MVKRYWWLGTVVALTLSAMGCSGGDDKSTPSSTPTALSSSEAIQESADAAAAKAQMDAEIKAAQKKVDALETKVKAEPSLDRRLSLIITAYCQLGTDLTSLDTNEQALLASLYEKYWQAGGRWNRPIDSAARQQGGCPSGSVTPPAHG